METCFSQVVSVMSRNYVILIVIFIGVFLFLLIRPNSRSSEESTPNRFKIASHSKQPFHTWKEFMWKQGNFKIMLPTQPHHVTDKLLDEKTNQMRTYDTFISADPLGQGFMVSLITFPNSLAKENLDELLNSVVKDTINRTKANKLNKMQAGRHKGYKAIDFSYDNNNRVIHGKVFAIKNTVYLLGVIDNNQDPDTNEIDYFMNSFDTLTEK